MRKTLKFVCSSAASVTALASASPVLAQAVGSTAPTVNDAQGRTAIPDANTTQVDQSLDDRDTSFEPVGAHFGSFMVYPKFEGGITYSDNIYAVANKTDDFIGRVSPSVDIRGDLGTATTALRASLDRYDYFTQSRESRTEWSVGGNTSIEATRGTFFYTAGGFTRAFQDRGDPNQLFTDRRPTEYNLSEVGGGFSTSITRLKFGLDASYRYFNYRDNFQLNGVLVNNQDRDAGMVRVAGRVGFEFSPGYSILARVSYDTVDYRLRFDDAGFNRSSHGFRGTLGVNFELSNLLEGEVWGGYLNRRYDDARFPTLEAAAFGSSLTWHPTLLTKVKLNVDRNVQETVTPGYRGFLTTSASVGVEHELQRNVTLSAGVRYANDRYLRATGTTNPRRNDENYSANASAKYFISRNVYTKLAYDWTKRSTDVAFPGIAFNRNRVAVSLGLQF